MSCLVTWKKHLTLFQKQILFSVHLVHLFQQFSKYLSKKKTKIKSCCLLLTVVVKENEQIRVAVSNGQRPDLSDITGPDTMKSLAVGWISRCWHQTPDERPTFAGIFACVLLEESYLKFFYFFNLKSTGAT